MSQKSKSQKAPIIDLTSALEKMKSKEIAKLEDIDINQLAARSGPILKRINALKNEQLKLVDLESKFYEELHQLECKYSKLYEPIFEKRRTIVCGEYEPTEEETKWALDEASEETTAKKPEEQEEKKTEEVEEKGIPHFWLETLQSFKVTAELVQEYDEPILAHLQDIRVRLFDQKPLGFALDFQFSENPYFTNQVLTKTYYLKTEIDQEDPFSFEGPDLEKSVGTKIDWKEGKNVTVKQTKKKIKPRNKKAVAKVITKEEKQDSFFNFFESKSEPENKQVALRKNHDHDESDEDHDEEMYDMLNDFEIGQYIREKVVPKAVLYYSGEFDDMDEEDYDYDEDEDEEDDDEENDKDEEDDDEDDDDDDDDDDEDDAPKGKKASAGKNSKPSVKGAKNSKGPEPTPSECKQN